MTITAAELIARHGPDAVGLRRVSEAAGGSHALVSHYFGAYGELVRVVLQRENERQRRAISLRRDPFASG